MKKHIKHIAMAAALMGFGISTSTAQELRTSYFMETSNFRHQMNPALLDQAYVGMPLLGNINIGTTGNVGAANFIYHNTGANSSEYPLTTFMSPEVSASQFLNGLNDKNRLDIYANLNLLSVAFRGFGGVNLIELNTRSNSHITMPYEMFEFMKTPAHESNTTFQASECAATTTPSWPWGTAVPLATSGASVQR